MVFWGMSSSSAKVMDLYGEALSIAFIRLWIVILALLPTLKVMKLRFEIKKEGIKYLITAAIFLGLYTSTFFKAMLVKEAY